MVDQHKLADALLTGLTADNPLWMPSESWRWDLISAVRADDAKALVPLMDRAAALVGDMVFDLTPLGRDAETGNLLAYCCFAGAFDCARLLACAFARFEEGQQWVNAAAAELAAEAPGKSSEESRLIARSIAEISIGLAMAETRFGPKHLYSSPMLLREPARLSREILAEFAARKFCSLGGRRSALRKLMASIAEGDQRGVVNALTAIQTFKYPHPGNPSCLFVMLDPEIRFFVGACINCDWPGCLSVLMDWLFGQLEANGRSDEAADVVLDVLNPEFADAPSERNQQIMAAISQSVSSFCDRRGELGAQEVRAVCGDLAPALREAATTATLISLSRREKADIEDLLASSGARSTRSTARL